MAMFERKHIFQSIIFGIHVKFPACNFVWCTLNYFCFFSFKKKEDSNEDLNDFGQWKRKNRSKWWSPCQEFDKEFDKNLTNYSSNIDERHKVGLQKHQWKMDISNKKKKGFH